jgi:predicted nucleic acid-binding protein
MNADDPSVSSSVVSPLASLAAGSRYFLDTNILVHSVDPADPAKQRIASDLVRDSLQSSRGVISFQVVQEFCSLARRKFAAPFAWNDLRDYFQQVLAPLCEVHSSTELYRSCLDISEQSGYSYYDSLILAAAASVGCKTLFSEDLQSGQMLVGLQIVNPFRQ